MPRGMAQKWAAVGRSGPHVGRSRVGPEVSRSVLLPAHLRLTSGPLRSPWLLPPTCCAIDLSQNPCSGTDRFILYSLIHGKCIIFRPHSIHCSRRAGENSTDDASTAPHTHTAEGERHTTHDARNAASRAAHGMLRVRAPSRQTLVRKTSLSNPCAQAGRASENQPVPEKQEPREEATQPDLGIVSEDT